MNDIKLISSGILGGVSAIGAYIINLLGGWSTSLETMMIFMTVDYITGVLCALLWQNSSKTESGAFDSKASIKGLFRKGGVLLVVLIAARIDMELCLNTNIRTTVILFFIANDGLSIIENLGIMGLPLPLFIKNAFERLKTNSDTEKELSKQ